jgi:hypothetical protein
MPNEDDRFEDVAEQLKQTDPETTSSADDTTAESDADSASTVEPAANAASSPSTSAQATDSDAESTPEPAFSFDATEMHGFYVRNETWTRVTRMESSVTAACSLFDVAEITGREFHGACLQVIADHGDEVALQLLNERGIDADADRIQEVMKLLNE